MFKNLRKGCQKRDWPIICIENISFLTGRFDYSIFVFQGILLKKGICNKSRLRGK